VRSFVIPARGMPDSAAESDRVPSPPPWKLAPGNWYLALEAQLCLSKYPPKFNAKFGPKCPRLCNRLRRQLRRPLNTELNLALYINSNPSLFGWSFRQLFETFFRQLFTSSFGSLFALKCGRLLVLSYLVLYRHTLPPGQSLGRPLHGRIVVGHRRTTTYG